MEVVKVPAQTAANGQQQGQISLPELQAGNDAGRPTHAVPSHHPIGCQEEAIATADPPRDTGCILPDTMAPGELLQRRIGSLAGLPAARAAWAIGWRSKGCWCWMRIYSRERPSHSVAWPSVMQRYGSTVRAEATEAIDRAALGQIVFHDAAERRWLEQLIYPIGGRLIKHSGSMPRHQPLL